MGYLVVPADKFKISRSDAIKEAIERWGIDYCDQYNAIFRGKASNKYEGICYPLCPGLDHYIDFVPGTKEGYHDGRYQARIGDKLIANRQKDYLDGWEAGHRDEKNLNPV